MVKILRVSDKTHQQVMLFKIQCKAKNAEEVLQKALQKLKGELNPAEKAGDAS